MLLLPIAVLSLIGGIITVKEMCQARAGYEDETGFHFSEPPEPSQRAEEMDLALHEIAAAIRR